MSTAEDNQPRYTTARLRYEVAEAKAYARREALEEAAKIADQYIGMGWTGSELPEAIRKAALKEAV